MLIQRLGMAFKYESPDVDESANLDEKPDHLVQRLAEMKANCIASQHKDAIVVGSDQIATYGQIVLSKSGNYENAKAQLSMLSGQKVTFFTGLCVVNTVANTVQTDCIEYIVYFRRLDQQEIEDYLKKEQPYDCVGSFKSEALGISLINRMEGDDPTALIGLPLIRLCEMLRREGVLLP